MAAKAQELAVRGDWGPHKGLKMVQPETSNKCASNLREGRYLGSIKTVC